MELNMKLEKYYYFMGCFFERDTILSLAEHYGTNRLFKIIKCPHVTFKFRPKDIPVDLLGQEMKFKVVGYGNDGKNEGLLVKLVYETFEHGKAKELYSKIKIPHITVSVSEISRARYTSDLDFINIDNNIIISGRFGVMLDNEDNESWTSIIFNNDDERLLL